MPAPTVIQWVKKLEQCIDEQARYSKPFEQRYDNAFVLPFIAQEYREVYGARADNLLVSMLEAPRTGAAAIGVDALSERLTVNGFESTDKETEKAVNQAWEDSDLDLMHHHGHLEALIRSRAFGVLNREVGGLRGVVTIESSEQAAVHRMAGPPYDVDVYFKRWIDEWTGDTHGNLKLAAGSNFRDIPLMKSPISRPDPEGSVEWTNWVVTEDGEKTFPGPVPVVEFAHMPRLLKPPQSEIQPVTTLVDLVDLIEGLMVFAGHFGAVPIRYVEGLEVPRDPNDPTKPLLGADGKPLIGFNPRADHTWFGGPGTKFGQLTPASLDTFVTWADHARANLRTKTKVASTYYALDLKSHMSAELLKTDEAPMVRRTAGIGRKGTFNQAWRRLGTMMAQLEGHKGRVRPMWDDENTRMEAQAVDAFQKAVASGIGVVTAAVKFLGWSRTEAEAAVAEHAAELERLQLAGDPIGLLDPATRARLKAVPSDNTDPAASA